VSVLDEWLTSFMTLPVQKEEMKTVVLRVMLHCEGCAHTVKRACARIPGGSFLPHPLYHVVV
jgi:copper chaperone CopZ